MNKAMVFFKDNKEEFIVSFILLFFAFSFNVYRVQSDGSLYYSYLETLLHIPNRESLYIPGFQQAGCAFFNAPFYFVAYAIENILHKAWSFNGITLRQASINIASNFYLALSLLLIIKILKRLNFKNIILPVISILFSTSAFCVAVIMPSFYHAVDIFVNTLFIYMLFFDNSDRPGRPFCVGLLYVIAVSVRYLNFILIIPALFYCLNYKKYRMLGYFLLGIICFFWVIPLLFHYYNGSILSPLLNIKHTTNTVQLLSLFPKNILKYLLHPLHGLFIWSPVTILSAFGLLFLPEKVQKLGYIFLGTWFLQLFFLGFIPSWSAGWSFSNRYLVNLFPIFVIGLSAILEKFGKNILLLAIVLTLYSAVLFFNWQLCIMDGEFGTPGNMVNAWIRGESPSFLDKYVNLKSFFYRLFEYSRYKYVVKIFK